MSSQVEHDDTLRAGHYAAKQIFCRDRLIAWSHRRRFELGLRLARALAGQRVVDYGCGDGTFLALLMSGEAPPLEAIGAELDAFQVDDCRRRLGDRPGLSFLAIDALRRPEHQEAYDAVVCMEVLEHVVHLDEVIEQVWHLVRPGGRLLASVPVETGVPLVAKQAARRLAGWRGIGDYPGTSPYTFREYVASVFAGRQPHLARPVYGGDRETPFHDHKGFNWRALQDRLASRFAIDQVVASPLPWLGPHLATQVWFLGTRPTGGSGRE